MSRRKNPSMTSAGKNKKSKQEPILMTDKHKGIITHLFEALTQNLIPESVLATLVSEGIITVEERDRLLQEKEQTAKAGALLSLLLKKEDRTFYTLIDACEKKGMSHLAKPLRDADKEEDGGETEDNEETSSDVETNTEPTLEVESTGKADGETGRLNGILARKKVVIASAMSPDGVVKMLSEKGFLTTGEKKIIEQKATERCRAETLISALLEKNESCLDAFLTALESTGQAFVAREIRIGAREISHSPQPGDPQETASGSENQQSATGVAFTGSDIFQYLEKEMITRPLQARICAVSKIIDYKSRQTQAMSKFVKFGLVTPSRGSDLNEPVRAIMFAENDVEVLHFLVRMAADNAILKLKNFTWRKRKGNKWIHLNEKSKVFEARAPLGIAPCTADVCEECKTLLYSPIQTIKSIQAIKSVKDEDVEDSGEEEQDEEEQTKLVSISGQVTEDGCPSYKGYEYTIRDQTGSIKIKVWNNQGHESDLEKNDQVTILDAKISTYYKERTLETCSGTDLKIEERHSETLEGNALNRGYQGSTLFLEFVPNGTDEEVEFRVAEKLKKRVERQTLPVAVRIKTKGQLITSFQIIKS